MREMSIIPCDVSQYNDDIPVIGSLNGVLGESGTREGPEELKCQLIWTVVSQWGSRGDLQIGTT